jgi:hypothetical protein
MRIETDFRFNIEPKRLNRVPSKDSFAAFAAIQCRAQGRSSFN